MALENRKQKDHKLLNWLATVNHAKPGEAAFKQFEKFKAEESEKKSKIVRSNN